ncbi:procollagen C-endopeptidase enhancer 2-like [Pocillopora verrucosa]|uniref:procollagen C-endopeptidase enhancer 2-like n=1 Tax=Pocillopora verrucosa TaxID=203993 RepID=UPI00333FC1EF
MGVFKSNQLTTTASVIVLLLFFGKGQCDSICPNGITNITAPSGELVYPESGTYGKNETKCWRITVPDTYDGIQYRISRVDVEMCTACKCDYLQTGNYYNDLHVKPKLCGRNNYNYLQGYIVNVYWPTEFTSGSTGYLRFVSDNTAHYTGFKLTFIAKSRSAGRVNYLNATEDETIEFGTPKVDIENYPSNYEEQWILIVPEGRNVQIDFDIFELEDSEGCKNDYVEFREASIVAGSSNGDIGPILTGRLCGNTKPNSILSQGNMVWVQFLSDGNSTTVNKGFKASFKAGRGSGLPVSRPMMLLHFLALIMHVSKNNLF